MVFVFFSFLDPEGKSGEFSYGGPDIESCFDTLNYLITTGWQLVDVKLATQPGSSTIDLPVDAFTGEPMTADLLRLEQTWKTLLAQPCYYVGAKNQHTFNRNQASIDAIHHALQRQARVSQQREQTNLRIANLFERADAIEASIQETKIKWGVV